MQTSAEQLGAPENIEPNKSESEINDVRSKMETLVKDPEWRRYMSEKIAAEYEYFLQQQGSQISVSASAGSSRMNQAKAIQNPQELRQVYEFMQQQWEEIQQAKKRITGHVKEAIRDKVISEEDRKFYKRKMKENVVSGEQIVTKEALEKAEKEILESLEGRKKERKEYDDLVSSSLVKDGFLIIDKDNKIQVPDENEYLKMSVPERRKWLKQIRDTLPKAEKYAEAQEKDEADKLTLEYKTLLNAARKREIIGDHTFDEFLEWFKGQNNETKKYSIGQFFKEMSRYQTLWKDIRKNLKGKPLSDLEGLRDQMGYTELRNEFMKQQYTEKLQKAGSRKILSVITNETVKKEILHARKSLNRTEKKTFVERITHFFSGRESDKQDAASYQDNVRANRKKHERAYQQDAVEEEPIENEGLKGARQNLKIHDVDEKVVERAKPDLKQTKRTSAKSPEVRIKKSTDRAYQQNTFVDEKGGKRRVVRVGGTKEGVQAFNNEALLNRDKDELSIMSKDGSNIVEMKMREIRVMKDVLKKSLEEDKIG